MPLGRVRLTPSNEDRSSNSRIYVSGIYNLCQSPVKIKNVAKAEAQLLLIPRNTTEGRLLRCIANICIGKAFSELADYHKAYPYFKETVETHNFSGAMLDLSIIAAARKNNLEGLYWLEAAQKNGYKANLDELKARARAKCLATEKGKRSLLEWEEKCKKNGLQFPEQSRLHQIMNRTPAQQLAIKEHAQLNSWLITQKKHKSAQVQQKRMLRKERLAKTIKSKSYMH